MTGGRQRFFNWRFAAALFSAIVAFGHSGSAQTPAAAKPATLSPKDAALIDITGYWVAIVNEDWRWRMMTPGKGDYASVPLNAEGKRVAGLWDPVKDEREGNNCKAYGAGNIMRIPARFHIAWADDNTMKMDVDAGMQTRLFHFDGAKSPVGAPQLQGYSVAKWEKQVQRTGTASGSISSRPSPAGTDC